MRIPTTVFLILSLGCSVAAEERLSVRPGITSERLVVRDPNGSVVYTLERTITGRFVVKTPDGSVVGKVDSPREEPARRERRSTLTLPESWSQ